MTFQCIECSNPKFTPPGIHFLTFLSQSLGTRRGSLTTYIPPGHENDPNLPMVLLLHGIFGNHWSWCFLGGAHLRLQELIDSKQVRPMGLIMPHDGLYREGSGYLKHQDQDCERWIVDEVVGSTREQYPCFSPTSPLFLAGFSMGGFGALRLGAKYAERFKGISAHSSITRYDQLCVYTTDNRKVEPYLKEEDLSALLWFRRNKDILPPVRFDCGRDDALLQANQQFHHELKEHQIPHTFETFEGDHTWEYWHEHLGDTLLFFEELLKQ
jgi:putative tributyrin esterase